MNRSILGLAVAAVLTTTAPGLWRGVAALCIGGGEATAIAFERSSL